MLRKASATVDWQSGVWVGGVHGRRATERDGRAGDQATLSASGLSCLSVSVASAERTKNTDRGRTEEQQAPTRSVAEMNRSMGLMGKQHRVASLRRLTESIVRRIPQRSRTVADFISDH